MCASLYHIHDVIRMFELYMGWSMNSGIYGRNEIVSRHATASVIHLAIATNVAKSSTNAGRNLQTPLGTFEIKKQWPYIVDKLVHYCCSGTRGVSCEFTDECS